MVSRVIPVDDFDLVIFGATGDLAHRKILPGLYRRFKAGQFPATSQIIGAARTDQDDDRQNLLANFETVQHDFPLEFPCRILLPGKAK